MTIRLLECPPVVWILRWYKLVINVEEHNTEFQIAANFKHKPCGNTRVIFSGDLQCLRLEETIIKTKTKNWDNLIFKTCILHSLELSNTSFFQNKKLIDFQNLHPPFIRFQVESLHRVEHLGVSSQKLFNSSPLCKSFFDYLQFWWEKDIPGPPLHPSRPQWRQGSEYPRQRRRTSLEPWWGRRWLGRWWWWWACWGWGGWSWGGWEGAAGIQSSCKEPGSHSFLHKRQLTKKLIDLSKQMTNWWKVWWSDLWHVVCCLPALLLGVPPLKYFYIEHLCFFVPW